jgi:hypothetical protein
MGHRWFIYSGCSWWNASGPKTIAATGATCVCIRHRGAFPLPNFSLIAVLAGLAGFFGSTVQNGGAVIQLGISAAVALFLGAGWSFLAHKCATFEDMLTDVSTAIAFARNSKEINTKNVVLGGYSSGGHVLTSLLSRDDVLRKHKLPTVREGLCNGVILLSGLFATRPGGLSKDKPRWLTDIVVGSVWDRSAALPSPLHTALALKEGELAKNFPPHLLVGCKSETFGIPLLDTFFCRDAYADALKRAGATADLLTVDANHWTVLENNDLFQRLSGHFREGWPLK